jgi:spore cortex biosynthesis protein YabQ
MPSFMPFLVTVAAGAVLGVVYDFFRVILNNSSKKFFLKYAVADFIFWLITGPAVIYSFYRSNGMNLRFYLFLGLFAGFGAYYLLFSHSLAAVYLTIYKIFSFFFKLLFTIVKFFVIIIKKALMFILTPFFFIWKYIVKALKKLVGYFRKNIKLMKKV